MAGAKFQVHARLGDQEPGRRLRGRARSVVPAGGMTPPTSSLRGQLCFLQFLEQSLDTKMGRCELVDEYILRRCPLRGATQQLVDSLDLRNQFRSVHRAPPK